ncbi:MAG: beta-lactamase family protein, partial [Planctomycetes bacterium]|nr:beta-lactamase family protein [Planctomycetota bacterium]
MNLPRLTSRALILLFLSSLAASAAEVGGLPVVEPRAADMDADRLDGITQQMRQYVEQGQMAGSVTLVAREGKIVHLQAVGTADVEAGRAMTPDTL